LELIDSVTNENLMTNQTFLFGNLTLEAQNNSEVLMQKTDNDQLLVSFDYNNAEGVYVLKNNGTTVFQFMVNVNQIEISCYIHNKIESVDFPGQDYEYIVGQNLYRVKL